MIPKIIHYCWFGKKKKPKLLRQCIKTWEDLMPEYQIYEWNEDNSDLSHPFVKEAYSGFKWAFVADYVRLQKIYEHGGVYLDTDIVAIQKLDSLLNYSFFIGREDKLHISAGVIGVEKNHFLIKKILKEYDNINFYTNNFSEFTIPKIITKIFREEYTLPKVFNTSWSEDNIIIFSEEYFYPFPFFKKNELDKYQSFITTKSFCVHLWYGSWLKNDLFIQIRRRNYLSALLLFLKFSNKGNKNVIQYLKKILRELKYSFSNKVSIGSN